VYAAEQHVLDADAPDLPVVLDPVLAVRMSLML